MQSNNIIQTSISAQMSKKWSQQLNNSREGINFDELFADQNFNVVKLLNIANIVDECKKQNEKVTNKLVLHPHILEDLIEICIRPTYFQHEELPQLTTQFTFKALEILNNLSQQFSEYLIPTPPKQHDDDHVITQQQYQPNISATCPLVTKVFKIVHDPKPIPETPLWYMYKINISLCYQKPKQVLQLFKENKQLCLSLFQHFYSNSVLEWVIKLLEIEDSNSFFQAEKIIVYRNFIQSLSGVDQSEKNLELKLSKYENYETIINTLLQKMEDRFDKTKFMNLTKSIYTQKFAIEFIVDSLQTRIKQKETGKQDKQNLQIQEQIFNKLLILCEIYLHFGQNYKTSMANCIKFNVPDIPKPKFDNSMNNSNSGIDIQSVSIVLNASIINRMRDNAIAFSVQLPKIGLSTAIEYLKLLRTLILTLQVPEYAFVGKLMTLQFVQCLFKSMRKYPKCNILHNLVRDIIVDSINKNFEKTVDIVFNLKECSFIGMISCLQVTNSTDNQYENQLYHIFQVTHKLGEKQQSKQQLEKLKHISQYEEILKRIKQKENLYNSLICQNPRQQTWGDEEQDDKLFNFNNPIERQKLFSPNNDFISGNIEHFVEYGLPLDSDESKDEDANMVSSDVMDKEDEVENYRPLIKMSGQQNQKKEEIVSLESQLAKKFRNIGVIQCQQRQYPVIIKKDRYGGKQGSSLNPFTFSTNPNINFNMSLSPKNNPNKLIVEWGKQPSKMIEKKSSREIERPPAKVNEKQKQVKDKQQIQLQKQTKILQTNRINRQNNLNQIPNEEYQIRLKKTVDSIDEDRRIYGAFPTAKQEEAASPQILAKSVDIAEMSGLLDTSQDKNKNIQVTQQTSPSKAEQSKIQRPTEKQKDWYSPEKAKEQTQKKQQIVNTGSQLETKKQTEETQKTQKPKQETPNKNSSKSRSNSANKKGSHFPTYLSFQIDEILAELE